MKHMNNCKDTAVINVIKQNLWKEHYKRLWYQKTMKIVQYINNENKFVDLIEFQ